MQSCHPYLLTQTPCTSHSCSLLLLWMLCSFTGRRKEERRESLPCGDLSAVTEAEASRRPSFLRMVSLGKLKRESMSDKASQEAEEETVEEEPVVKTREPLSGNNQGVKTSKCRLQTYIYASNDPVESLYSFPCVRELFSSRSRFNSTSL